MKNKCRCGLAEILRIKPVSYGFDYQVAFSDALEIAEKSLKTVQDEVTPELMREALDVLRLARKESTQAFSRASYRAPVQTVFDILDAEEKAD